MSDLPPGSPTSPPDGTRPTRRRFDEQELLYLRWFIGIAGVLVIGIAILAAVVLTRDDDTGETVATEAPTDEAAVDTEPDDAAVSEPSPEPQVTPDVAVDDEETPEEEPPEFPPCPDNTGPDADEPYGVTGVANQLNQRAEPSIEGELAGEFPVNTRGLVLTGRCSQSTDQIIWWEVEVEGGTVWAAAQYLQTEAVLDAGPCAQGTFDATGRDRLTSTKADVDGDGTEDKISLYTDGNGVSHGVIEYGYGGVSDTAYQPTAADIEPSGLAVVASVRPNGLSRDVVIARGLAGGTPTYFLLTGGSCELVEVGIPNSDGTIRVSLVAGESTGGHDLRCAAAGQGTQLYDSGWAPDAGTGEITETVIPIELGELAAGDGSIVVGTAGPLVQTPLGNIADGEPTYTYGTC